jgi:putative transposase
VTLDRAGRYHISFVVEVDPEPLPKVDQKMGMDLGLTHFLVTSDGDKVGPSDFLKQDLDRLARAGRQLARKKKGSKNRRKAARKVARIHARIADKRRDMLHKLSTRLIRENQAIALEDLSVRDMLGNQRLSRSISDAGWGMFRRMLEYKADWYGRQLHIVDRFFPSSKLCSACGGRVEEMPLNIREWRCPGCGALHDRDVNAARNLKSAAGLAVRACGERTALQGELFPAHTSSR